ncbi:MAG: hypothetical protein ACI8W8_004366 [Rhodothermales bacterium]|jgi:hypothetical protein
MTRALLLFTLALSVSAGTPIFDGKTLDGWKSPDMSYWSIQDGAITAASTTEHPCKKNQFLVWQLGDLDDFELTLKFRIVGSKSANSGIQIRSQIADDGHAIGYQADIDLGGNWAGALYDEHTGRRALAKRGKKTVIAADGSRESSDLASAGNPLKEGEWNTYSITARGPHITLAINGQITADVIDNQPEHRDLQGKLALQLHSGPAMTVQFKDIELTRLALSDDRKKIVFVAGAPSHPPGQHEFNAGVKLLSRCLRDASLDIIVANHHDSGWPTDPTALDNADGLILYMDGWHKHAINGRIPEVDALMKRGGGLMCMHYAVHTAEEYAGKQFLDWIGGYYETGYSANPHWKAEFKPTPHAITQGVSGATIEDEWYFNMRFRDGMEGVTSIISATPADSNITVHRRGGRSWTDITEAALNRPQTLMWATERKDGGRGVGFTGGHWHKNWAHDVQRKLVLNGILWASGAKVPAAGAESSVTAEQLAQNHDDKPTPKPRKPRKPKAKPKAK